MLNGKPVDACRNIVVDTTPDSSKLTARGSSPANAGKYTVTAQNEAGVESADFSVVVIGKSIKLLFCVKIQTDIPLCMYNWH